MNIATWRLPIFFIFAFLLCTPFIAHGFTTEVRNGYTVIKTEGTSTSVKITIDATKEPQIPINNNPRNFRITGIKVWGNKELSGVALYDQNDISVRSTKKQSDLYQTHTLSNLSPNTTYYFQYFEYKERENIGGPFQSGKQPYASMVPGVYTFKTDTIRTVANQSYTLQKKEGSNTFTVTGKPDSTELVIVVRRDTAAGAIGATTNASGEGLVSITPNFRLPTAGSIEISIPNLTVGSTYYATLAKKIDGGKLENLTAPQSTTGSEGFKSDVTTTTSADYDQRSYRLLAPFPGLSVLMDPDLCEEQKQLKPGQICDINEFLNYALKLLIGLSAVFLILKIMYIGGKYMTTDIAGVKANAKGELMTAGLGLLVALTSYLILNTINPSLVSGDVAFRTVKVGVEELVGDIGGEITYSNIPTTIQCPKTGGRGGLITIAKSFGNKTVYSQTKRGQPAPNGRVYLDCSSYVATVLTCAGFNIPGVSTTGTSTSTMSVNPKTLKIASRELKADGLYINGQKVMPGDILGWKNGESKKYKGGHVVMYTGNNKMIDVYGPNGQLKGATERSLDYVNEFKYMIRVGN